MRIVNRNFPPTVRLPRRWAHVRVARRLRIPTVDAPGALKATPQPLAVRRRALAPQIPIGPQPQLAVLQTRPIARRGLAPAAIARQAPITAALLATLRIVRRVPWAAVIVPTRLLLRATVAILRRHVLTLRLRMVAAAAILLLAATRLHRVVTPLPVMVAAVRVAIAVVVVLAATVEEEVLPTAAAEVVRTAVVVADLTAAVAVTVAAVDTTKIYPPSVSSGPSSPRRAFSFPSHPIFKEQPCIFRASCTFGHNSFVSAVLHIVTRRIQSSFPVAPNNPSASV